MLGRYSLDQLHQVPGPHAYVHVRRVWQAVGKVIVEFSSMRDKQLRACISSWFTNISTGKGSLLHQSLELTKRRSSRWASHHPWASLLQVSAGITPPGEARSHHRRSFWSAVHRDGPHAIHLATAALGAGGGKYRVHHARREQVLAVEHHEERGAVHTKFCRTTSSLAICLRSSRTVCRPLKTSSWPTMWCSWSSKTPLTTTTAAAVAGPAACWSPEEHSRRLYARNSSPSCMRVVSLREGVAGHRVLSPAVTAFDAGVSRCGIASTCG